MGLCVGEGDEAKWDKGILGKKKISIFISYIW